MKINDDQKERKVSPLICSSVGGGLAYEPLPKSKRINHTTKSQRLPKGKQALSKRCSFDTRGFFDANINADARMHALSFFHCNQKRLDRTRR